jgi:hypothetical protein
MGKEISGKEKMWREKMWGKMSFGPVNIGWPEWLSNLGGKSLATLERDGRETDKSLTFSISPKIKPRSKRSLPHILPRDKYRFSSLFPFLFLLRLSKASSSSLLIHYSFILFLWFTKEREISFFPCFFLLVSLFSYYHTSPAHTRTLKMGRPNTHTTQGKGEVFLLCFGFGYCGLAEDGGLAWLDPLLVWKRIKREFLLLFCNRERSEGRGRLVNFCRKQRREMEMKVAVQFLLAQNRESESWERWKFCCVISLRTVLSCCPERWTEREGVSAEFLQWEEEKNAWKWWGELSFYRTHERIGSNWAKTDPMAESHAWAASWRARGDESHAWKKVLSSVKISLIFNKLTLSFNLSF